MSFVIRAVIVFFASFAAYAEQGRYLCHADEDVVFSCELGKKIASVCASHGVTQTTGYVQYRFGMPSKLELVYPTKLEPPKGKFYFSHTLFSGGDGVRIRFISNDHEYFVFSKSVRTNFAPNEPNNPEESAGIFTRFNGKYSRTRECLSFAAISGQSTEQMDAENYDDDAP